MSDENESPDGSRLDELIAIIEKSRRLTGHSKLSERDLEATVDAFDEIVASIPTDRLRDMYVRVMRSRDSRATLQPTELLAAWHEVAVERQVQASIVDQRNVTDNTYRCLHCRDQGYQHVLVRRGIGYVSVCARPCVCDAAPAGQRSREPLTEPLWRCNLKGEWERVRPLLRSAAK